jgi:hypothetical protein
MGKRCAGRDARHSKGSLVLANFQKVAGEGVECLLGNTFNFSRLHSDTDGAAGCCFKFCHT